MKIFEIETSYEYCDIVDEFVDITTTYQQINALGFQGRKLTVFSCSLQKNCAEANCGLLNRCNNY